jgi:PAS domain S-box-containing protein
VRIDDDLSAEFAFDRAGNISSITRPEDRDWTRAYIERIVQGDREFHSVKRFLRRDGSEFSGSVTIRPLVRDDRCVGIVGVVAPIRPRELIDDPRVSKLLEHSASTITLIDADGNVIETAGRYRATLGYPKEFWEARTIFDVLVPEDAERVVAMRDDVLAHPRSVVEGDFTVVDAAGSRHILEVTAVNLLDDPDLEGIVITSRNVTDERTIRAELTALRDEAVAEADQRARLVATVSHELRNPLHAVTGLSELLASDATLPPQLHELASTLHRQVMQLTRVTDDLLDAAQLEIGDGGLRAGPTSVRRVVEDIARLGRSARNSGRVAVWASVDECVPAVVDTDGGRLHQLLLNLVGNAVKFTDDGEVGISVTGAQRADGRFELHIAVRDTGRGIPPDDLAQIFEPFGMAANAGTARGAGLGLAVASRIVTLLGGSIELTSEMGRGSTFRVSFPVDRSDQGADLPDRRRTSHRAGQPLVLVVEDNAVNQDLARHQLTRLGAVAVVTGTAEEAIELATTGDFDAILMDHQLPGMNGRDATRELRRRNVMVPIIGMTASATAADEQACMDAGMDAFLAKPVGLDRLSSTLDSLTARTNSATFDTVEAMAGDGDRGAVDTAALTTLAEELGGPAIVIGLVQTFLAELERRRAAIGGNDPELIAREAHTLKSSARLLGAFHLATICEQIETDPSQASLVDQYAAAAERAFRSWLHEQLQKEAR